MSRHNVTDAQWQVLNHFCRNQDRDADEARTANRKCLNGILYVLKTGVLWADLPEDYGSPTTCWHRFDEWSQAGV